MDNPTPSLTELPVELIQVIFSRLPLADLVKGKQLCKKIRFAIEQLHLNELIVFVNTPSFPLNWTYDHSPVNLANSIELRSLSFMLKSRPFAGFVRQFRGLRRLLVFEDCLNSVDHTKSFNLVQALSEYRKSSKGFFQIDRFSNVVYQTLATRDIIIIIIIIIDLTRTLPSGLRQA